MPGPSPQAAPVQSNPIQQQQVPKPAKKQETVKKVNDDEDKPKKMSEKEEE